MNDLIKSLSIEQLLIQREGLIEKFQQIQILAHEMQQLGATVKEHHHGMPEIKWYRNGSHDSVIDSHDSVIDSPYNKEPQHTLATFIKEIDRSYWAYLMDQSGMLGLMDSTAKKEWQDSLHDGKYPDLTLENIHATFQDLQLSQEEIFKRGLIKVFQSLSRNWKSNDQFKLGKKVIIHYFTGYSEHGQRKLDDLLRCFYVLDGKPEPAYSERSYSQMRRAEQQHSQSYENEYVKVTFYKGTQTGHVNFKRMDLVELCNKIVWTAFPFHLPHDNRTPKAAA